MIRQLSAALAASDGSSRVLLHGPVADALKAAGVAVALLDTELRYVWSVNLLDAQGREPPAGATDHELFGSAGEELAGLKARAVATGAPVQGELHLPVAGAARRYELTATPQRGADGIVTGLLCVLVETTARSPYAHFVAQLAPQPDGLGLRGAQVSEAIAPRRDQERAEPQPTAHDGAPQPTSDLLQAVVDGVDDGLLLLDGAGSVLAVNQPFADLCGTQASTLVGSRWPPQGSGMLLPSGLIEASLADGQPRIERVVLTPSTEAVRTLELRTLPQGGSGRSYAPLVVWACDVTAQEALEARFVEAERFASNQRLVAAVVHEVNTPLQAIESCLHMSGKLADAESRGRYLRLAREEIQRVGQIMRQLLDLYRPAHRAVGPVALNDLIERALLLVGVSLARQGVVVERDLAAGLPLLSGRADELTQVLLNLIMNAMQAMRRGGRLTVRTRCERPEGQAPRLELTVSDSGPGIEAEVLRQIFEPFFTTRSDGHGLGLAVCQRIVAAHGGSMTVTSAPGQGASFLVILPLERAEGPAGRA